MKLTSASFQHVLDRQQEALAEQHLGSLSEMPIAPSGGLERGVLAPCVFYAFPGLTRAHTLPK